MTKKLDHAKALYLAGIQEGRTREHTTQHGRPRWRRRAR